MRKMSLEMVYRLAKKDRRVFFIGSDLGFGTLLQFEKELPGQFLKEGVSEAYIIGLAAGLALEGKIVYINTIATFLTRRCFEQIVVDLALHRAKVRLIGSGGGLVYAPLGPTHLAIEDIAIMRAIPNMTVIACADSREMEKMMLKTVDWPGPIYIRLAKGSDPLVTRGGFTIGRAYVYARGKDVLLVTTGITLQLALEAKEILGKKNVKAGILHVPTLKPLDKKTIIKTVRAYPAVISVEEHSLIGGLGSGIAEIISEADFIGRKLFRRIALPDEFPEGYGSQKEQLLDKRITVAEIVKTAEKLLK
ncbi:MAG: transketolase domain-containing protein, transketolase [Candidatus Gottesmanbacteria bacterium GW2011_GWA2_43_14]|uniref:Transketolase domain-containing protein, transketolase n=1 Tax=Candidatus Gottesmanbacteria bacterium GW2011_GWA2_43_14 TaxID=1618443 RepID=A0A0G1DJP3_9BACT|nr:MAG: transketolase domain-containing protein, transketolase [Candidatus Gottesmanbacteria bacterium GW2011_GWA2_43_14]